MRDLSKGGKQNPKPDVRSLTSEVRLLPPSLFLDLNIQAPDLLIEGRKWHVKAFCGFRLIPVAAFQHVGDDSPLHVFHDFEQRSIRRRVVQCERGPASEQ